MSGGAINPLNIVPAAAMAGLLFTVLPAHASTAEWRCHVTAASAKPAAAEPGGRVMGITAVHADLRDGRVVTQKKSWPSKLSSVGTVSYVGSFSVVSARTDLAHDVVNESGPYIHQSSPTVLSLAPPTNPSARLKTNSSARPKGASINTAVDRRLFASLSLVPEADIYGMLVAGVGLMVSILRRRQLT